MRIKSGSERVEQEQKRSLEKIQDLMGLEDVTYKKTKIGTISNMT